MLWTCAYGACNLTDWRHRYKQRCNPADTRPPPPKQPTYVVWIIV